MKKCLVIALERFGGEGLKTVAQLLRHLVEDGKLVVIGFALQRDRGFKLHLRRIQLGVQFSELVSFQSRLCQLLLQRRQPSVQHRRLRTHQQPRYGESKSCGNRYHQNVCQPHHGVTPISKHTSSQLIHSPRQLSLRPPEEVSPAERRAVPSPDTGFDSHTSGSAIPVSDQTRPCGCPQRRLRSFHARNLAALASGWKSPGYCPARSPAPVLVVKTPFAPQPWHKW